MQRSEPEIIPSLPLRKSFPSASSISILLRDNLAVWPSEQQTLQANNLKLIQMQAHRLYVYLDQHFVVFPDENKKKNFKNLKLLADFKNVNPNTNRHLANQILNQLMPEFRNYFIIYPPVKLFYELCLVQLEKNNLEISSTVFIIDELFFTKAAVFTIPLAEESFLISSVSPVLYCFNDWLTSEAIALHRFEPYALKALQRCWDFVIERPFLPFNPSDFVSKIFQYVRPLMNLYHDHLERRLIQLRATAKMQQTHYIALSEKIPQLKEKIKEQMQMKQLNEAEIKKALIEEVNERPDYKKTADKVTAILRYGPPFRGKKSEKLPSAIVKMMEAIEIKEIPQSILPTTIESTSIHIPEKENKEENKKEFPIITTHLFDLETLKVFNKETGPLLKALETSSFWRERKIKFRAILIQCIKKFNDCFLIPEVSDKASRKIRKKGNIFLKNLMTAIQDSSITDEFISETQYELEQHLKNFIFFYGKILKQELNTFFNIYEEMRKSTEALKDQVVLLESQFNTIIQQATELDVPTSIGIQSDANPYKKALLSIVTIILYTDDIELSPQLISELMKILRYSYTVLIQFQPVLEEKEEPPVGVSVSYEQQTDLSQDMLPRGNLPWESLVLLSNYSQTLLNEYKKNLPEQSWFLSFQGKTDRLGGFNDRRTEYLSFTMYVQPRLKVFHEYFTGGIVSEYTLQQANMAFELLFDMIKDSSSLDALNWAFYQICKYEEKSLAERHPYLTFLGWEHLKELNQAGQALLPEIKKWPEIEYGRHTNVPLLVSALEYFNQQFSQTAIQENKDAKKTLKANKALLCFMQMVFWDSKELLDLALSRSKWLPFVSQYNQYIEDTIDQLHIGIQKKKKYVELLQNRINDLKKNVNLHDRKTALLQHQIQVILKAENSIEPACINALKEIILILEKSSSSEIEKNILALVKTTLEGVQWDLSVAEEQPVLFQAHSFNQEEKSLPKLSYEFSLEGLVKIPLLPHSFLQRLKSEVDFLFEKLRTVSSYQIGVLIGFSRRFREQIRSEQSEKEANQTLHAIIRDISHFIPLDEQKTLLQWAFQRFLIEYCRTITDYLQHLREVDYEYTRQCNSLTKQIDKLNADKSACSLSSHPSAYFNHKLLASKLLKEERAKNKPAVEAIKKIAMMIFNLKDDSINIQFFPIIIRLLQLINTALYGKHEKNSRETYSFKFR